MAVDSVGRVLHLRQSAFRGRWMNGSGLQGFLDGRFLFGLHKFPGLKFIGSLMVQGLKYWGSRARML